MVFLYKKRNTTVIDHYKIYLNQSPGVKMKVDGSNDVYNKGK
jgi:hypothetical protein